MPPRNLVAYTSHSLLLKVSDAGWVELGNLCTYRFTHVAKSSKSLLLSPGSSSKIQSSLYHANCPTAARKRQALILKGLPCLCFEVAISLWVHKMEDTWPTLEAELGYTGFEYKEMCFIGSCCYSCLPAYLGSRDVLEI